jgi:hypothetical protein
MVLSLVDSNDVEISGELSDLVKINGKVEVDGKFITETSEPEYNL